MKQKKPLSDRENEAFSKLRIMLPEYEIHPNLRLADIIEVPPYMFKSMGAYHLDFVIWDNERNIIAAVEIDDSTHDTADGKRRDSNKNKWLNKAKIKLIRIRDLKEISSIREKIRNYEFAEEEIEKYINEDAYEFKFNPKQFRRSKRTFRNNPTNSLKKRVAIILISGTIIFICMIALYKVVVGTISNIGKNSIAQQQKLQQENQKRAGEKNNKVQQPHYERVFVKGKSARECAGPSEVLDNDVVKCMNSHYEMVFVSGNQ